MREWQVGDPIGDGNDIGVPDIPYMGYLKNKDKRTRCPNNADIRKSKKLQEESWKLKEKGNFSDALTYINSAIYYNPNDEENWNIKGIILWKMAVDDKCEFFDAVECFDNALLINPNKIIKSNKARCMMDWAMSYLIIDYLDLAMREIDETLSFIHDEKCEDYAHALNIKSRIFYAQFKTDSAIECINKAIKILPDDETFQNNREAYISRFGADEETLLDVVDYNIRSGNDEKASKYYYELGFKFQHKDNENDKEKAVQYLKKAVEFNPDNKEALYYLGYALYDLKKYREAIPYFKRSYNDSNNPNEVIADCYVNLGEYESAIHYLDKGIEEAPLWHEYVEKKVECLVGLNKNRQAIKVFDDFSNRLKSAGYYYESIKYIDEILKMEPGNSYFLNKKEKMLKDEKIVKSYNILKAIESTEITNHGSEDEDLKSYIETVSESSGESIEYILSLYQEDDSENYDYIKMCNLAYVDWARLISMYPQPESQDTLDSPATTVSKESPFNEDNEVPQNGLNDSNNPLDLIKQAKELLDDGAITQEEYEVLKRKYLDLV